MLHLVFVRLSKRERDMRQQPLPRETIQLFRYLLYQSFQYLISLSDELLSLLFGSIHIVIALISRVIIKNTLKCHRKKYTRVLGYLIKFKLTPCVLCMQQCFVDLFWIFLQMQISPQNLIKIFIFLFFSLSLARVVLTNF